MYGFESYSGHTISHFHYPHGRSIGEINWTQINITHIVLTCVFRCFQLYAISGFYIFGSLAICTDSVVRRCFSQSHHQLVIKGRTNCLSLYIYVSGTAVTVKKQLKKTCPLPIKLRLAKNTLSTSALVRHKYK